MSYELFEKVCADLLSFPKRLKLLRFCGLGDSLFNKDIVKFVECASKKKVSEKIELITNGLLLREKHFPAFSKKLTRLIVSIEGLDEEDYLKYTNRRVDFKKFVDQLAAFSKLKDKKCNYILRYITPLYRLKRNSKNSMKFSQRSQMNYMSKIS